VSDHERDVLVTGSYLPIYRVRDDMDNKQQEADAAWRGLLDCVAVNDTEEYWVRSTTLLMLHIDNDVRPYGWHAEYFYPVLNFMNSGMRRKGS
jgi:hypothetical protein